MSQKTTSKAAKKPSVDSTTVKKSKTGKAVPKKMTMAEMQKSLKSLETRMKRANTLTRKSVTTLEDVVSTLDSRTKKDRTNQRSALSRRVGQLSSTFEENMATTRQEIKSTLSQALAKQNIPALQTSISEALSSLDRMETQQAKSIAKINRHLANLAKAVEDRIVKDQIEATEALHRVETRLSSRLESIQADTADAISTIGNKVETLSNALEKRNQKVETLVAQKISDLASRTQAEFDSKTNSIQERLEKLEQAEREAALIKPDALNESMSSHVSALAAQVETLKNRLATIDASFNALQNQTQMMNQDIRYLKDPATPHTTHNIVSFAGGASPTQHASTPTHSGVASSGQTHIQKNPYEAPLESTTGSITASTGTTASQAQFSQNQHAHSNTASHIPVEFDPRSQTTQTATALAPQPYIAADTLDHPLPPPPLNSVKNLAADQKIEPLEFKPEERTNSPSLNNLDVETLPVGAPQLPYEDPAYAETEEHVDQMRVGADHKKASKKRLKKRSKTKTPEPYTLPPINGQDQNTKTSFLRSKGFRIGALATGVTLVGLFAAKSFMEPGKTRQNVNDGTVVPTTTDIQNASQLPQDPIGIYEDNASPIVNPAQANTLESAAANGNPIAEYQLGITYMEDGRIEEGIKFIRKASATMPAAQYRLAKLYETGTGVAKDTAMARGLTERAARAGNRIAMHDLAIYYAYGNGDVEIDMGTAAGWFTKAAERGVVDSQFNLAILYENGQGVLPSPADAYFWYSIAAAQGDQSANARIAALKSLMTPEDIAATQTRIDNFQLVKINPTTNGIFNNLPWNQKNTQSAESQLVQETQTMLSNIGFDVGTPDGIMGRRTQQAIKDFERINGMAETGLITDSLIAKLSVASGA